LLTSQSVVAVKRYIRQKLNLNNCNNMEIQAISLARMNNGAHFQFVKNALAEAKANTVIVDRAAAQVAVLEKKLADEDEALKISQKSLSTDDIVEADRKRDELYTAYRKLVKGSLSSPLEEQAEAAKILNQSIKDYGIDPKMQLDKEVGLVDNLLTDHEGKYAEQVKTLGLTAYVTAMREANDKVNDLIVQRDKERSIQVAGALKAARAETDTAYKDLVKRVNALWIVEYDAAYDEFINYMNEAIDRYRKEVLAAKKKKTTDGGDDDKE